MVFGINLCIYCNDVYNEKSIANVITVNTKVDGQKVRTHSKYEHIDVRNCNTYKFYWCALWRTCIRTFVISISAGSVVKVVWHGSVLILTSWMRLLAYSKIVFWFYCLSCLGLWKSIFSANKKASLFEVEPNSIEIAINKSVQKQ